MDTPAKMQHETYPVRFSVDYPDRELNRVATAFRAFAAIPILTVLATISGGTWQRTRDNVSTPVAVGAGGLLCVGPLLMIVFRQKYPFVVGVIRWNNRVIGYAFTMVTDQYPPFGLS